MDSKLARGGGSKYGFSGGLLEERQRRSKQTRGSSHNLNHQYHQRNLSARHKYIEKRYLTYDVLEMKVNYPNLSLSIFKNNCTLLTQVWVNFVCWLSERT